MDNSDSDRMRATGAGLVAEQHESRVSRRAFFKAAGIGAAGVALGVSTVTSAQAQSWDEETDVVVVGSGGAALSGAAGALLNGAKVAIFEKGPVAGGTTAKSGGAFWIPNSPYMQEQGLTDPKDDALKYMARLAFPHLYRADDAALGLSQNTYDLLSAFYDEGPRATRELNDAGALASIMSISWTGHPTPDYWAHLPENKAPRGRTTNPKNAEGNQSNGAEMVRQLAAFAESHGSPVRVESQVTKLILDDTRRVVGVEVVTPEGTRTVRALKGVIFGSGGFTQNPEMRYSYLRTPVLGGCAVPTNQGDLVNISIESGVKLGNMNEAWLQQEILEEVLQFSSVPSGTWFLGGDSMIAVNKFGLRLYDEKFVYNERTRTHLTWNPTLGEYSNLYQFLIYDDHAREYGGMLRSPGGADLPACVIQADTVDDLAAGIQARLDRSPTASACSSWPRRSCRRSRRRSPASTASRRPASISTSIVASRRSTSTSTGPAPTTTSRTSGCTRSPAPAPITASSSPRGRWTPRAGRAPMRMGRCSTCTTSRSPGSMPRATARPRRPGRPIGAPAARSGRR